MDFMFEDEADEVGSDVEAYCPKCKADTTHVVISKYEEEIRRVQCNPCGDVHSYRKPRGETEDDVPEPVSARKRAALKKLNWDEFFARKSQNDAKPYEFRERYRENLIVRHPKFGVGFVSEVVSDSKVEITFQDARRILVHNRRDIPGLPLAAEGDGVPTPPKSTKAPKETATKAAPKEKEKDLPALVAKPAKAGGKPDKPTPPAPPQEKDKEPHREASKAPALKLVSAVAPAVSPAKPAPAAKAPVAPAKPPAPAPKALTEGKAHSHKAVDAKPKPAVKPAPVKAVAKPASKAASKPPGKGSAAKSAAPRGAKTAAKPAAKKPAPQPKKKSGKKR
jgi:hypothetical protein